MKRGLSSSQLTRSNNDYPGSDKSNTKVAEGSQRVLNKGRSGPSAASLSLLYVSFHYVRGLRVEREPCGRAPRRSTDPFNGFYSPPCLEGRKLFRGSMGSASASWSQKSKSNFSRAWLLLEFHKSIFIEEARDLSRSSMVHCFLFRVCPDRCLNILPKSTVRHG